MPAITCVIVDAEGGPLEESPLLAMQLRILWVKFSSYTTMITPTYAAILASQGCFH